MSALSSALGNMNSPGMQRLRGTGGTTYQAAKVGADPSYTEKSQLLDTVGALADTGSKLYGQYQKKQQDKADERSNEIIRSLTPEQRRDAIQSGTLLYQDDPYAMEALKVKTGRNAAYLVDDDVAQKVKNGEFRTREDLEKYRQAQLQKGATDYANMFGIDEADEYYKKGFNSDITERNMALYGAHDNFLSEQAKQGAVINSRVELNSVLGDPTTLKSPHSGQFFEDYFKKGLETGSIPSDNQAYSMISQGLSDVVNKEGGSQFLQQIENRSITLHGKTTTFKGLMGNEAWNSYMVTAQANEYKLNAKRDEDFKLQMNSALNQPDTHIGWEQLQVLKNQLNQSQTGEEMTPQREALIAAEAHMQNKFVMESQKRAKEMDDLQMQANKNTVIDEQFNKRINGQYVSTKYTDLPTNGNTGEFTHSDMVNYADKKLADIEKMDIPDEQKDNLKLQYLKADSENGAFRTQAGQLIDDATQEWNAAVINGRLPENPVAMNALRRVRNADPNLFASLYPEKAEMLLTMDAIDRQGVDPQILLEADKSRKGKTKEMQYEDDQAWKTLMDNSQSPELKFMPAGLQEVARKVYDSEKYRSGNPDRAAQQVDKYLKENTTTFTLDGVKGDTVGVVTRNALRITDDPDSWRQGKDVIETAAKKIAETHPWVTNGSLTIHERGDSIWLTSTNGQIAVRYDKTLLSKMYADNQQRADEQARKEALKDANKRTLYTRNLINQHEKEAKRPVRKGSMYDGVSGKGILDTLTGKE